MTPERWQTVAAILAEIIQTDLSEQQNVLKRLCGGDETLRGEVESLLAAHHEASTQFLETPAAATNESTLVDSLIARRVGAFRIVSKIATGGMGEVYRAERDDGQYQQQVAVKLIRPGILGDLLTERFQVERQILASLEHPNIARLIDGGITGDNIPYLVMEFIDGEPIDLYCERRQLTLTQRLDLFLPVCASVQYAHQRLIVHRDLKPNNILVTNDGTPKLLDFGIAKVLGLNSAGEGPNLTMIGAMTPEYSSPEQIRGGLVTTSSDIYSLGVVLYRLLSGRSPYQARTEDRLDFCRAVCEALPTRPSTDPGGINPAMAKSLRGDLDSIILKALRKEPDQRYATAEQFAADIRRYLRQTPVLAREPTTSYRFGKFFKRNKLAVAASAVALATLIGGLVMTLRQAALATAASRVAEHERARAEKRFDDVRELSNSLIYDVHDAIRDLPGATGARKILLDRAIRYLDNSAQDAADSPALQRELAWGYQRLAVVQGNQTESNLGDRPAATLSNRKALDLFERVAAVSTDPIDQLNVSMMHRVLAYDALSAENRHHLDLAIERTARLLAANPTDPRIHSEASLEFQHLAFVHDSDGDRAGALRAMRMSLAQKTDVLHYKSDYRHVHELLGNVTVLVGDALAHVGSPGESAASIRKGIEWFELEQDRDSRVLAGDIVESWYKLGDVQLGSGDLQSAHSSYATARAKLDAFLATDPNDFVGRTAKTAADFREARWLAISGDLASARTRLQVALKNVDPSWYSYETIESSVINPGVIELWLGEIALRSGESQSALRSFQNALALLTDNKGTTTNDDRRCQQATSLIKAAHVLTGEGQFTDAAARLDRAWLLIQPSLRPELNDVPAIYAAANARIGFGDLALARALAATASTERNGFLDDAKSSYEAALTFFNTIPNLAGSDAIGLPSLLPADVDRRRERLNRLAPGRWPAKSTETASRGMNP